MLETAGLQALEKACETCHAKEAKSELPGLLGCPEELPDDPKHCTADQCKKEAKDIIRRLVEVWDQYYGPLDDKGDPVGGHLCGDWAKQFEAALQGSHCFAFNLCTAEAPRRVYWDANGHIVIDPHTGKSLYRTDYHVYLQVWACGNQGDPAAAVTFDDGFNLGGGSLPPLPFHPGVYPPETSPYKPKPGCGCVDFNKQQSNDLPGL